MNEPISELQSVTCHMGSHSVTCHPTEVNAPHLNPSQIGQYSIYYSLCSLCFLWFMFCF